MRTNIAARRTCILYSLVPRYGLHGVESGCNEECTKDAHLKVYEETRRR